MEQKPNKRGSPSYKRAANKRASAYQHAQQERKNCEKGEKEKQCEEKGPGFAIIFSPKDETHIYTTILIEDRSGWSWMQHYYPPVSA